MQADAVSHYHWMTGAQFLNAVALGQITPGPVVQTVAVVGYCSPKPRSTPATSPEEEFRQGLDIVLRGLRAILPDGAAETGLPSAVRRAAPARRAGSGAAAGCW
jgi:Chromate transporter